MANKKPQQSEPDDPGEQPSCDEAEPSEVEAAAEAVRRAKHQLREARRAYWQLRRQTVDQLKQIREMSVGDLVDDTLKRVKRHPGPSVIVAVLAGFFLGRLFRR